MVVVEETVVVEEDRLRRRGGLPGRIVGRCRWRRGGRALGWFSARVSAASPTTATTRAVVLSGKMKAAGTFDADGSSLFSRNPTRKIYAVRPNRPYPDPMRFTSRPAWYFACAVDVDADADGFAAGLAVRRL